MAEAWTPGAPKFAPRSTVRLGAALDALALPDGRKVGDVRRSELVRALIKLGVPGVSHEHGKYANVQRYAEYLDGVAETAGKQAVQDLLKEAKQA